MTPQRLLLLATDRLSAYLWRAGRIALEAKFAGDANGREGFARYLEQHRDSTFRLLALQAEDNYQLEAIPRVRGQDRTALLARKLGQHFYGARLNFVLPLGRERGGRGYERLLFAALAGDQQLEPWLQQLAAARIRLAGLYTPPLLAGSIGAETAGAVPLFQLLTLSSAGMHQIVFGNGQPRLSRLTRLSTGSPQEAAAVAAAESAKIYQYLIAQRIIDPGEVLTTVVLIHPRQLAEYRGRCIDTGEIRYIFADLCAAAKKRGLKTPPQDSCSEAMFLHSMIRRPPRAQFAPAPLRRSYQLWRLSLALTGLSAAILIGSVLVAGVQLFEYRRLDEEIGQLRALAASDGQRFAAARQRSPSLPIDDGRQRAVVERLDRLDRQAATLEPMFQRISRALEAVPGVSIERIDWSVNDSAAEGKPGGVITEMVARLPAELASDPRAQLDAIGRFSAVLRLDQAVAVSSLALPLEIGSSHSLKGGSEPDSNPGLRQDAPQFSLRLLAQR
ncbi:MAG TPA: hypothetical protein VMV91_13515 [Rhodocyclaceae bacterium]|nr:hypothetical protein [Rhodocyclaceae bacterium]